VGRACAPPSSALSNRVCDCCCRQSLHDFGEGIAVPLGLGAERGVPVWWLEGAVVDAEVQRQVLKTGDDVREVSDDFLRIEVHAVG